MRYTYRCHHSIKNMDDFLLIMEKKNHCFDDLNPEYVFVFGGDGTVLKTIHEFMDRITEITLVGINFGKLGFYTDYLEKDILELVSNIEHNEYDICSLPLINYEIKTSNNIITGYALNETTIISSSKTIVIDTFINNEHFETFRGTGLCVSTPSGSTAYNKSLGGAIVDINIPAMQLTEIASINNRVYKTIGSSMILSNKTNLLLIPKNNDKYIITIDNLDPIIENVKAFKISLANKHVQLLTHKNHSFFNRVKKAFIGENND